MEIPKVNYPVKAVEQFIIMGHCYQSGIVLINSFKKKVKNTGLVFRIKVSCCLVSKNQPGVRQQGPADGSPLLLALGKVQDRSFQFIANSHGL